MPIWLQPGHFHCTTQGFQRSKNNIQDLLSVNSFRKLSRNGGDLEEFLRVQRQRPRPRGERAYVARGRPIP